MRPRKVRRLFAAMGAGAILAGTGIGWAARADASPNICGALTVSPTVGTVELLVEAFVADGWSAEESGQIIATTVDELCPEKWPVLERFIAAYTGGRYLA